MLSILRYSSAFYLLILAAVGCQAIDEDVAKEPYNPLKQLSLSSDGVALEVVTVRFPHGDPDLGDTLWDDIDEQKFSAETRRQLALHGFRAGVIGERVPTALEKVLLQETAAAAGNSQEASFDDDPPVLRRVVFVRAGGKCEVLASGVYDEVPLLRRDENGAVGGDIYRQAQGLFAVKASPQHDGRVRLHVTPELQHGQPKQQFIQQDGMFRPQAVKPRRTFDQLALDATLGAGQMLVLATYADTGSVGHYFLTEDRSGDRQQKLIILRLAKTKYDDLFAEHTKLPSGESEKAEPQ